MSDSLSQRAEAVFGRLRKACEEHEVYVSLAVAEANLRSFFVWPTEFAKAAREPDRDRTTDETEGK
jgi:hypothetical protein